MSRRHNFRSFGNGHVEMVCVACDKREWMAVTFDSRVTLDKYAEPEDWCMADLAADQSPEWRYTHDDYVCSKACAARFWEW